MAALSTSKCVRATSGYSRATRSTTRRHRRDVSKMFCLSTEVKLLAARPREIQGDARDALDLGRAIDHRVHRLLHAVYDSLLFGLAEIDAAGQLAHDDEIDRPARARAAATRRLPGPERRGPDAGWQTVRNRGATGRARTRDAPAAACLRIAGSPTLPKRIAALRVAERARLVGKRGKATRERVAADRRFDAFEVGTEHAAQRDARARNLGADAVARKRATIM